MIERIKSKILDKSDSYKYYKNNYQRLVYENSLLEKRIEHLEKLLSLNDDKNQNTQLNKHYLNYKKSKFYQMESKRIYGHSTTVNWDLDDKVRAYSFVEKYGVVHPKIYAKLDDIDSLKEYLSQDNHLDKFVLKISNQHSAAGVFLLRKISEDLYFDDLTSKAYTLDDIVNKEKQLDDQAEYVLRDTYYFIEESVDNFIREFKIPFDYKIFCFNGIPKLILQMNRNVNNVSIAFFDGNFIPLAEGKDWFLNHEKATVGVPVIPPSAYQMLSQTIKMAKDANKRHVRIDWFDNGQSPVFGEFTFASGGSHSGLFTYSDEILENIDNSIEDENYDDYSNKGYNVDTGELFEHAQIPINLDSKEYRELLTKCSFGKLGAMVNLVEYIKNVGVNEPDPSKRKLYQHLKVCWEEALLLYDDTRTENICRHVKQKYGFIHNETPQYMHRLRIAKNALWRKAQYNTWFKLRFSQFIHDFGGNEKEIKTSNQWIEEYSRKNIPYAIELKKLYNNE